MEAWPPGPEILASLGTGRRALMRIESRLWVSPDGKLSSRSENVVTDWRAP